MTTPTTRQIEDRLLDMGVSHTVVILEDDGSLTVDLYGVSAAVLAYVRSLGARVTGSEKGWVYIAA